MSHIWRNNNDITKKKSDFPENFEYCVWMFSIIKLYMCMFCNIIFFNANLFITTDYKNLLSLFFLELLNNNWDETLLNKTIDRMLFIIQY